MDDDYTDLALAEALGNATLEERRAAAQLRATAGPALRHEFDDTVAATSQTLAALAFVTAIAPPPTLRVRVLTAIGQAGAASPRRSRPRRWLIGVAAAAAAVVLVGIGVIVGHQTVGTPTTSTAEQVITAADARTTTALFPRGGAATVVYSKSANAAILLLSGVQAPPTGRVYQMWLVGKAPQPVSAGIMTGQQVSAATTVVPDLDGATALAFSVEPPGGSPQPTTQPFAAIKLG
ncbi:anti-sigma factor [Skermania sp. ID1734]|uniref:anti-sigma factor n=1 Tax=Skermania sp. ID1734 TaxID=2597516 RepID=UPI00163DB671|nr:anti-sigma factor [Skermania sp. ID1734]